MRYGALRFDQRTFAYLQSLPPTDRRSHFCLATLVDDPIEVLGTLHYRVTGNDLYFEYIRVRDAYRFREVGRRMLTEVVLHPTCIRLGRLHWTAGTEDCAALIRYLAWLRDNVPRLCGTPFKLDVARGGAETHGKG